MLGTRHPSKKKHNGRNLLRNYATEFSSRKDRREQTAKHYYVLSFARNKWPMLKLSDVTFCAITFVYKTEQLHEFKKS